MPAESLSPVVVHQLADAYVEAARREFKRAGPMDASVPASSLFPAYFLVGRAIELALKSSLLLRGYSVAQLKNRNKLGHDLVKLVAEAGSGTEPNQRVVLSKGQQDTIAKLNDYYLAKDLEYPATGAKSYPRPELMLTCADEILRQVEPRLRRWRPSDR